MVAVKYLLFVGFFLFLVVACTPKPAVICNAPYMLVGQECCLDSNNNSICDKEDGLLEGNNTTECPQLDCSLCPAQVIEKPVETTITKYICAKDGKEVNDPKDCAGKGYVNLFKGYTPVTTNEEGTAIKSFTIKPACQDSEQSVGIHFDLGTMAPDVTIQVKEKPDDLWKDYYTYNKKTFNSYLYAAICNGACTSNVDFYLPPGKAYLIRAKIDYRDVYGEYQFTNEHIVDATTEGEYMTKLC